jgi:hypothetical protein
MYIEPIYLQAEESELPELKRVVVGYGGDIVIDENLDGALAQIFGEREPQQQETVSGQMQQVLPEDISGLASEAYQVYQEAQEALKQGNWQEYGDKIEDLNNLLEELNSLSGEAEQNNEENIEQ